jgi:hypothetical protein
VANFATIFPCVVDIGGKFATCVNDTGGNYIPYSGTMNLTTENIFLQIGPKT